MFRAVVLFAFLATISAFVAPANKQSVTSVNLFNFGKKKAAPAKAAPAPAPVKKSIASGEGFAGGLNGVAIEVGPFDPLGLSAGKSAETLEWYRAAELKHGRICMLAFLGLIIQPIFHLPDAVFTAGNGGYGSLVTLYNDRPQAIWQILTALAAIETGTLFRGLGAGGDFEWDPLNYKKQYKLDDPENFASFQTRELKNGRMAMIGTSLILLQEYQTGGLNVYDQLVK